jgi:LmbE family N-acetylglucosaminyl deacetylase
MLHLHNATADLYIPDGVDLEPALRRTTHLAIGAHQDDLEIMALHGIITCFGQADQWFTGVICTNGAGSPRAGMYADYTDTQMQRVRVQEQRTAAQIGHYAAMLQLDYASSAIKDPADPRPADDLTAILKATRPTVVYVHNPADKHPSHVGVALSTLRAIRRLPADERPDRLYGCEVWRDLDWLPDNRKVVLDVSAHENLATALVGVFDSQVAGGKRYDLATLGRRRANATYLASHATDEIAQATFAIDLSPLLRDESLDVTTFTLRLIDEFRAAVHQQLSAVR